MRKLFERSRMHYLTMRFSGGGAGGEGSAGSPGNGGTADPAAGVQPPADPAPADPAKVDPTGKAYTETDLELARQQAVTEYKARLAQQKSYDEMNAEEKVAYLEAQQQSIKLEQHTTRLLADSKLSVELVPLIKGKDEVDTAERIKQLKVLIDKEVQAGVEARFKDNAYQPRGNASGGDPTDPKARERGVKVQ